MSRVFNQAVATVLNGQSLSGPVAVGAGVITALIMPPSWTSAAITFKGSIDGVNYYDLYDSYGAEVSLTVAAGHYVSTEAASFAGITHLKLRSGTGAVPVNQTADSAIQIVARKERGKQ